jgi:DNA-binding CsgD family transcriptional regulator
MHRLDATEERRVGRFVVETAEITSDDEPFPAAFLAALRRLVPCDDVSFSELDRVAERELGHVSHPRWDGPEPEVSYWEIRHEHPVCHRHEVSGDFSAHRLTDFVTPRQLRRSRLYAQWFRPQYVHHQLTVGLDAPLWHTKVFLFSRGGGRDFSERDCAVLDALRPYLGARYALWEARRRLDVEPVARPEGLTPREREIVALLRAGLSNAEIAGRLSIAPGTVRRHLENVYGKLDVHTRTAALAKLRMA